MRDDDTAGLPPPTETVPLTSIPRSPRKGFLRQVLDNNLGQLVAQAAAVVRLFVLARLLGPEPLGVWSLLMLIVTYGVNGQLGFFDGMNRLAPLERAGGSRAARHQDTAFTATLTVTGVLAAGVAIGGLALVPGATFEVQFGIIAMAATLVLYQFLNFQMALQRFDLRFDIVRDATVLRALSDVAISIGLVQVLGLGALFVGLVASHLVAIGYLALRATERYRFRFDPTAAGSLLASGSPILLSGLAFTLMTSVDRLVLARFGTEAWLGYYSVGSQLGSLVYCVPAFTASVVYIHFLKGYGESGQDPQALRQGLHRTMLVYAPLIPLLAVGLSAATPLLGLLLPRFAPGIDTMRIVVLASGCLAMATVANNLLVTVGRAVQVIAVQLVAAASCALIGATLLRRGMGPEGAAFGSLGAYALYAILLLFLAARQVESGSRHCIVAGWVLPFLALAAADAGTAWAIGRASLDVVTQVAVREAILVLIAFPWLVDLERKTRLGRRLLGGGKGSEARL